MRKLLIITLCILLSLPLIGCSDLDELELFAFDDHDDYDDDDYDEYYDDYYEYDDDYDDDYDDYDDDYDDDDYYDSEDHMSDGTYVDSLPWGYFPFSFSVHDLYGNTVTEESMGEKQLFFVHLWATWCPPCIAEMPDLAIVAWEYGDRVGFIGLLDDFGNNPDGAINILESSNKPDFFITVDANDAQFSELLALVHTGYVPTTVIFTSDGDMFEPLIGAYFEAYAVILDAILED